MDEHLSELLFNAVNEQGYLFQDACEHALRANKTGWAVEDREYPVSLGGEDTRVDMVLKAQNASDPALYALVECKRADPEYVCWLFAAPGLPESEGLFRTIGFNDADGRRLERIHRELRFDISTYLTNWWLEAKDRNPRGRTSTSQNIESAFQQVLKGMGGFAQEQLQQRKKGHHTTYTYFVPIVITTASLYVANYEARDIDLSTGKIREDKVLFGPRGQPPEEVEWVLVDYGVGSEVGYESPIPNNINGVDPAELKKYKTRSIFVVNSKSIPLFFSRLSIVRM